jgi:hypothetical protein
MMLKEMLHLNQLLQLATSFIECLLTFLFLLGILLLLAFTGVIHKVKTFANKMQLLGRYQTFSFM